jgi:hypothetical protein
VRGHAGQRELNRRGSEVSIASILAIISGIVDTPAPVLTARS